MYAMRMTFLRAYFANADHFAVMSVFELNVRGYSDWTDAFTMDEWKWFGYTQDLTFYYCAG